MRWRRTLLRKPAAEAKLYRLLIKDPNLSSGTESYKSSLLPGSLGRIGLQRMADIDALVRDKLNPKIQATFQALAPRVHFVDLFSASIEHDFKGGTETNPISVAFGSAQWRLTNLPLDTSLIFGPLKDGGIFGLDNLHPTVVGYGIISQKVCEAISQVEQLPFARIDLQQCFEHDTLLTDLPRQLLGEHALIALASIFIR